MRLQLVLATKLLVRLVVVPFGAERGNLLIIVERVVVPAVGEKVSPTRIVQINRDVAGAGDRREPIVVHAMVLRRNCVGRQVEDDGNR